MTTTTRFRPMLAATLTDANELRYPVLASPKLDGIRCVIRGGHALTRALKPVPNMQIRSALEELGPLSEGFDGELMLPYPATFQAVSSAVMSHRDEPPGDWFFAVFDCVPSPSVSLKTFEARAQDTADLIRSVQRTCPENWRPVMACRQKRIESADELMAYEADMLEAGHEGVMLRSLDGPYKFGRATEREGYLLKLKRFLDSEAEVVDVLELQHNHNEAFVGELGQTKRRTLKEGKVGGGVLGKLVVRDLKTGVEFRIGTGFTADQRALWWRCRDVLIGRVVRYRYQEHGVKDKPRIASFTGFRDRRDMDDPKVR